MCDRCGNPNCPGAEGMQDMMAMMGDAPEILISKAKEPDTLLGLDDEAYAVKVAVGVLVSTVMGLLPDQFEDEEEAARAAGFGSAQAMIERIQSPDLTLAEIVRLLRLGGRELTGLAITRFGGERARGEQAKASKAATAKFAPIFAKILQTKQNTNKEIS
jgi:hypothetical protein